MPVIYHFKLLGIGKYYNVLDTILQCKQEILNKRKLKKVLKFDNFCIFNS